MVQEALRGVVREALEHVARDGLPGKHHFYITFDTNHPGVAIAEHLTAKYPQEMTIILQHQFFGLEIEDEAFEVSLSFNKVLERLRIPFAALISFVDPSVNFGLQLRASPEVPDEDAPASVADNTDTAEPADGDDTAPETVVSLDSFRKK